MVPLFSFYSTLYHFLSQFKLVLSVACNKTCFACSHQLFEDIMIELNGEGLTLEKACQIANGTKVTLSAATENSIRESRELVKEVAARDLPVYSINTGFGFLANTQIENGQLKELQTNIIRSHACGYGEPLPEEVARLALALRLNVFAKALTGVRFELCQQILKLLRARIHPVIPRYGSVGASGDLIPLAHLSLPIIGEGEVYYKGDLTQTSEALAAEGIEPYELREKEGLSLINGTQIMLSVGGLALAEALALLRIATKVAALSYEGMEGIVDALDERIHKARCQVGQAEVAEILRTELEGSYLHEKIFSHKRVQDPYSLRCVPQIHGPSRDALRYAKTIIERELNAGTDNPLVFSEDHAVISAGNFHGQALALAFDFAAIACSELANVSERRLELLLNPHFSNLKAFLTPDPGLCSGYMTAQYLSASLVNENKILANPACTDSIPGNVGVEDHVSMGMTSARKLTAIVENLKTILSAELVAAAQAVDLRGVTKLGKGTRKLHSALREKVPVLEADRVIAKDIQEARTVVSGLVSELHSQVIL